MASPWRAVAASLLSLGLGACNQLFDIPDISATTRPVGGEVRGLWTGNAGVALSLHALDDKGVDRADGTDGPLTVTADGAFRFATELGLGVSYRITVESAPARHTCLLERGATGTVGEANLEEVLVTCIGPAMAIDLTGRWSRAFDPDLASQTFDGSVAMQTVGLTIRGPELTAADVDGTAAMLGAPLTLPLPLGDKTLTAHVAAGELSRSFQLVFNRGATVLAQLEYAKASNTGSSDRFGNAVSISGDTLAVGASLESSDADGVNGNQQDNTASFAGAVYVFVRRGRTWTQQAYLKASRSQSSDFFGAAVSLSGDTLAVGAYGEACSATGVNKPDDNEGAPFAGAAYVFVRNGAAWSQQAYLKASNTGDGDGFGASLSLDGDNLAVGASSEDSVATGIGGNQNDNTASGAGATYVFVRSGTTWAQQAYLKASNTNANDAFGESVSLSGNTLAVGASKEASAATGVGGNQADNSALQAGAAYVFTRTGTTWAQQAYLKASNTDANDFFGAKLALSGDTLAVAARGEASAAVGVDGNQRDNTAANAGAAYVFLRSGTAWAQQAYLKASNTDADDRFGTSIALSGDTLAIGATSEASTAKGIDGNQLDNTASGSGAVYLFTRSAAIWAQRTYVKASNSNGGDDFGGAIALSGNLLAVGAVLEDSNATGLGGGQANESMEGAGACYLFD